MRPIPFNTRTPPGINIELPADQPVPIKIRAKVSNLPRGREGFLMWLQQFSPPAAERLLTAAPHLYDLNNQLEAHLGDVDVGPANVPSAVTTAGAKTDWTTTVKNVLGGILSVYQQKKLVDLQLQRARAGQAPLDLSDYTDDTSLKVGLDKSTRQTAFGIGGVVLAGIAGLVLFMAMKRGARGG